MWNGTRHRRKPRRKLQCVLCFKRNTVSHQRRRQGLGNAWSKWVRDPSWDQLYPTKNTIWIIISVQFFNIIFLILSKVLFTFNKLQARHCTGFIENDIDVFLLVENAFDWLFFPLHFFYAQFVLGVIDQNLTAIKMRISESWLGSSVGRASSCYTQGCEFDPWSGHVQEYKNQPVNA